MRRAILVVSALFAILSFTQEARAQVYKYVDKDGVVHFTDTPTNAKFAPLPGIWIKNDDEEHRETAGAGKNREKIDQELKNEKEQLLPLSQGGFMVQLVEALKIGQPKNEAQAQNMLSSVGIEPSNGWNAMSPVTPIIIVEINKKVARAADAGKLTVKKDQALKAAANIRDHSDHKLIKQSPHHVTSSSKPSPEKLIIAKPSPSVHQNVSNKFPSTHGINHPPTNSQPSTNKVHAGASAQSSPSPQGSVKFSSTHRPYQNQGSYPGMETSPTKAFNPEATRVPPGSIGSTKFPSTREFYNR